MNSVKNLLASLLVVFSVSAYALDAGSFNIENEFNTTEFSQLDAIDNTVSNSETISTLPNILAESGVSETTNFRSGFSQAGFSIDSMDWKSFAWGFCCCPIGFFVVVLSDNKDSDQKLSYWIGVAANVVLSAVSNGIRFATL